MATAFAANSREVFRDRALKGDAPKGISWLRWRPFPILAFSAALNLILGAPSASDFCVSASRRRRRAS
ncbi:MAG: hypothetical protein WDO73_12720 [Ignavibacteriota bacterium]